MTITQMAQTNFAYRNMYINQLSATKSLRNLSSGLRINGGADDAAGLAVSEGMRGQISGLSKAYTNSQNAISLVQTAEGHLNETSSILTRMKELAVSSANGTLTDDQRSISNIEFNNLKSELNRISSASEFNGIKLLDGSLGGKQGQAGMVSMGVTGVSTDAGSTLYGEAKFTISKDDNNVFSITAHVGDKVFTNVIDPADTSTEFDTGEGKISLNINAGALKEGVISNVGLRTGAAQANVTNAVSNVKSNGITFQIGANGSADQRVSLNVNDMSAFALGLDTMDISTLDGANDALKAIDKAITQVAGERGGLGAMHNRLEHTINNLGVSRESLIDAESTIRDADMALEMMNYTQKNLLAQASQAMMAQGMNMTRQNILSLLAM